MMIRFTRMRIIFFKTTPLISPKLRVTTLATDYLTDLMFS